MLQRFICFCLTTSLLSRTIAVQGEFVEKPSTEDKLFGSIVRARNSVKVEHSKRNDSVEESSDKQPRTTIHRVESDSRGSSCCGSKYGFNSSTRPDSHYNRIPMDSDRYSVKFGDRLPVDRYGWQTQGQPPGLSGNSGRLGTGNYAAGGFYDGGRTGERFASRPSYSNDSPRKPVGYDSAVSGGYGYGSSAYGGYGFNRPSDYGGSIPGGSYGISGTFANGDEFGPAEPNYPEENVPPHPSIQTQKAVALKALAGVALIGAAAALATNPVLLPIGVVSGRRKRSSMTNKDRDAYMDYILTLLKNNIVKTYNVEDDRKVPFTLECIARFICEIEKDYWSNLRKGIKFSREKATLERRLVDRISSNVPNETFANARVRKLIKAGTMVASNGGSCNAFTCTFIKATGTKSPAVFKF